MNEDYSGNRYMEEVWLQMRESIMYKAGTMPPGWSGDIDLGNDCVAKILN